MIQTAETSSPLLRFFRAFGPALIVASVVLGPGSILSSSKVGAAYGFRMAWVVVLAGVLMTGMVAMGARLGVVLKGTLCDELAQRIGRPFAAMVGLTIFFICAGFQFGNNLGVLAALEPMIELASEEKPSPEVQLLIQRVGIVVLNLAIIGFLFLFRRLYTPVETLMKILVATMIVAFVGNFVFLLAKGQAVETSPARTATIAEEQPPGKQPSTETTAQTGSTKPSLEDQFVAVIGLIATTFSIAGAFYQGYLVREKGWGKAQLKQGLIDSVAGISVLGMITLVIMLTAAMSFHGKDVALESAGDVARQLEPLFGPAAVILFSLGIFAAAFSSFLVNAMIGGSMLADGLGLDGSMNSWTTKSFTALALLIGLVVALFVPGENRVGLIVFAQAMVVIGFPLLALSMLYLAFTTWQDLGRDRRVPPWMIALGVVGMFVVLGSAVRLTITIAGKVSEWLAN